MNDNAVVRWASGINILAGLWVLISPWLFHYNTDTTAMWISVVVGVVIAILAAIRFSGNGPVGLSWINLILGIWVIISPWVIGYSANSSAMWDHIIVGIIIGILAIVSAVGPSRAAV